MISSFKSDAFHFIVLYNNFLNKYSKYLKDQELGDKMWTILFSMKCDKMPHQLSCNGRYGPGEGGSKETSKFEP